MALAHDLITPIRKPNPRDEQKYGMLPAAVLDHIEFWCKENKIHNRTETFYKGRYWTHRKVEQIKEDINTGKSLWSIRYALRKLKKAKILLWRTEWIVIGGVARRLDWYSVDRKKGIKPVEQPRVECKVGCNISDEMANLGANLGEIESQLLEINMDAILYGGECNFAPSTFRALKEELQIKEREEEISPPKNAVVTSKAIEVEIKEEPMQHDRAGKELGDTWNEMGNLEPLAETTGSLEKLAMFVYRLEQDGIGLEELKGSIRNYSNTKARAAKNETWYRYDYNAMQFFGLTFYLNAKSVLPLSEAMARDPNYKPQFIRFLPDRFHEGGFTRDDQKWKGSGKDTQKTDNAAEEANRQANELFDLVVSVGRYGDLREHCSKFELKVIGELKANKATILDCDFRPKAIKEIRETILRLRGNQRTEERVREKRGNGGMASLQDIFKLSLDTKD